MTSVSALDLSCFLCDGETILAVTPDTNGLSFFLVSNLAVLLKREIV